MHYGHTLPPLDIPYPRDTLPVVISGDLFKLVYLRPLSPMVLTSSGGHQSGRYVSYWNAFLFEVIVRNLDNMYTLRLCLRKMFPQGNPLHLVTDFKNV